MPRTRPAEPVAAAPLKAPAWRVDTARDFDVLERDFSATRVVGVSHRGPLTFAGLATLTRSLDAKVRAADLRTSGPLFTVLRSNPYETAPSRRRYLTCVPVVGSAAPPEGLELGAVHGGLFVVTVCPGGLPEIDEAFGFLFGRFFAARGQELARPEEPEIRLLYPTAPHQVVRESAFVAEVAVPVVITMRTDSLRNQR